MESINRYLSKDLQEIIETAVVRTYKKAENDSVPAQKEITFEAYGMKLRMLVYFAHYGSDVDEPMFCQIEIERKKDNNRYETINCFHYGSYALHRYVINVEGAVVTAIAEQMKNDVKWFAIR